eukprot:441154-Amphidinium_carterae.1
MRSYKLLPAYQDLVAMQDWPVTPSPSIRSQLDSPKQSNARLPNQLQSWTHQSTLGKEDLEIVARTVGSSFCWASNGE